MVGVVSQESTDLSNKLSTAASKTTTQVSKLNTELSNKLHTVANSTQDTLAKLNVKEITNKLAGTVSSHKQGKKNPESETDLFSKLSTGFSSLLSNAITIQAPEKENKRQLA